MLPWGADLQNVHAYVRCAHGGSPYLIDGGRCGDVWGRPFYYPPFLFHFFFWMRRLTLETTMHIWTVCLYLAFGAILYLWAWRIVREPFAKGEGGRHELPVFCALLLFQYPFVFALERGNTDTVAILFYTLAAFWFVRRRLWLAGAAAGLAAGFRLYPALAVIVVTAALLLASRSGERRIAKWGWLHFGGGAFAAFVATLVAFPKDALIYFRDVLPGYAKTFTFSCEFSHSVPTYVGAQYPAFAVIIAVALLGLWVWASARAIARGEEWWALAGALAVSTFNQRTSWDYNLITVYPIACTPVAPCAPDQPLGIAGVRGLHDRRRPAPVYVSERAPVHAPAATRPRAGLPGDHGAGGRRPRRRRTARRGSGSLSPSAPREIRSPAS